MNQHDDAAIVLKREELYERVWTTAMWKLAPSLGLSDRGLHKVCKRHSIPTPPLGYWAKKEHGKAPRTPKLPACADPQLAEIKFFPNTARLNFDIELERAAEAAPEERIAVPATLDSPHPLVVASQQAFAGAGTDEVGMLKPRTRQRLAIRVTPSSADRGLRIMDGLLKALAARGLEVSLEKSGEHWWTTVTLHDEPLTFGMYENTKRVERDPTPAEKRDNERYSWRKPRRYFIEQPTGQLSLVIHSGPDNGRPRRFTDSQRRPLDNLLNAFVSTLYLTAQDIKDEREKEAQRQRDREEAARKREEFLKERAAKLQEIHEEEKLLNELKANVTAWETSQSMRRYVEAARAMVVARDGAIELGGPIDDYLVWATRQADRLDPLVKSPPSILDEKPKWERHSHW